MDDALLDWRGGPRRVLFEAASPLSLAVFQPIYERLRHDERIEFWFTVTDESWDADRVFKRAGILPAGKSFEWKAEKRGAYPYLCKLHPGMVGSLTVK